MEGRRWREHQPGSSDPETQQNNKHQRSESARERMVHVCVRVCARVCVRVQPYLHYLCAGMRDEVLLVGIYDSHLDQSIGLPVSA